MTISLRSDAAGGAILADGIEKIRFDSAGRIVFSSDGSLAVTGDFKHVMRATAPVGWVAGDGSTIGNAGSGATRANVDTLDLFTLWWTDYSDAQLPILTSVGGASTRGASAAADWAALKRLTVFDVRGRFPRSAGTINGVANPNGTKQDDAVQDHSHATALPAGSTGSTTGFQLANPASNNGQQATTGMNSGRISTETRPINIAMLGCFKL